MENMLAIWVDDEVQRSIPLSQFIIMEKTRSVFKHLQEGDTSEAFVASRGWFDRFKRRRNLHSIRISGEAASADTQTAKEFPQVLQNIIKRGNYLPQLVFNVDETGLFWKRMPSRTFISREKKRASGFKAGKIV